MKTTPDQPGPCHDAPVADSGEFAPGASTWLGRLDEVSRRAFMKRMAAGVALATGAIGCSSQPDDTIVPRADADDHVVPGKPIGYATTLTLGGYGRGAIAISREGRPIKIEGNPDHPSNLGGTDVFMQAAILDLYDPTRSQTPTFAGSATNWPAFANALAPRLDAARADGGARLRLLVGTETSPTLAAQLAEFERVFPKARWHLHDPLERRSAHEGTARSFGRPLTTVYDFARARAIVSLDADFLFDAPGSLRYARDFSDGRRVRKGRAEMSRLYVVESSLTLTGATADHRRPVKPSDVWRLANLLGVACGLTGESSTIDDPWLRAAADDLIRHRGASLVVAGDSQPPDVHMIAHAINEHLGNFGNTARFTEPIELRSRGVERSLDQLIGELDRDAIDTLILLGGDPAYTASARSDFAAALERFSAKKAGDPLANFSCHLGERLNATSFRCQWHLPESHPLESWGDARGHDGTASLVQPLIEPLFSGRTKIELVDLLLGSTSRSGLELVRRHWRSVWGDTDFEARWQRALSRGAIDDSAPPAFDGPTERGSGTSGFLIASGGIEVVFRPDPSVWDGSFAANAWLQELPRPFTKIVWDNALLVSPATAGTLGVSSDDVVRLTVGGESIEPARSIETPIAILPGIPDGTATLHLGYGQLGSEHGGANAYAIRSGEAGYVANVKIETTGRTQAIVTTRSVQAMPAATPAFEALATSDAEPSEANRRLARVATLDAFRADPDVIAKLGGEKEKKPLLSLYPEWDYSKGYQWGMSIDTSACIGCNACIVACQAENNIPVVGKEQVHRQREMHWLRVDTYADENNVVHQPVPCMHCENAPCEVVCPVAATTHSVEGLNQMTYNRCVGTRYCSNNCPYKVRRFNFFNYTSTLRDSTSKLAMNPEVTVRTRGVMEKCSFCIQRLQRTRIDVERVVLDLRERARRAVDERERSTLEDDAKRREFDMISRLDTACAQACPTRTITFGSIRPVADQPTRVMAEKAQPHDYVLLRELTTKPRVSYLGKVTNPNADLPKGGT